MLIDKITKKESNQMHQTPPKYTHQALELLNTYHWPGNVRELKNLIKRIIILKPGEDVTPSDIEKMIFLEERPPTGADLKSPPLRNLNAVPLNRL